MRRVLKGVYVAAQVPDSLTLRTPGVAAGRTPRRGGDRLDGVLVLHRGAPRGSARRRSRRSACSGRPDTTGSATALCAAASAASSPTTSPTSAGLRITTPLRTAWDLGRLAHRDRAIGALDALLRHGSFTRGELVAGVERFKGMRGVVQLRSARAARRRPVGVARRVDAAAAVAGPPQPAAADTAGPDHGRGRRGVPAWTSACPSSATAASTTARSSTASDAAARPAPTRGPARAVRLGRRRGPREPTCPGHARRRAGADRGDPPGASGARRVRRTSGEGAAAPGRRPARQSRRVGTPAARSRRVGAARAAQSRRVSGGRGGRGGSRRRRTRRAATGRG